MNDLTRREFLQFIGGASALGAVGMILPARYALAAPLPLGFTPIRLPHPLPLYTTNTSFLASGLNGAGGVSPVSPSAELVNYTVIDDVVVPPEFERYIILRWGERVFPNFEDYVGYNHDFTAFVPLAGTEDGLLYVHHEYTSYPFHEASPGTSASGGNPAFGAGNRSFESVVTGVTLPTLAAGANPGGNVLLVGEQMYNVGFSVVRIKRTTRGGRFAPIVDSLNRRVHGLSGLALNTTRSDGFQAVTAWGPTAHQTGDSNFLVGTGPAAAHVFTGVNADGLGNQIIGTFSNCSGGITPWGTCISCEENFQGSGSFNAASTSYPFYGGVTETVLPNGSQTAYTANTAGNLFGLVGEKYGWVVETDVRNPNSRPKKHTSLGRFRHENFAARVDVGQPLVVYSGDDRRGGHTWKWVSQGIVKSITDPGNSLLFESGTLYVAKLNPDGARASDGTANSGTGVWVPLTLDTLCNPNDPVLLGAVQLAQQGVIDRNGLCNLPRRLNVAAQPADGGFFGLTTVNRNTLNAVTNKTFFEDYRVKPNGTPKKVSDFYASLGAALCDAFAAGNLIGGTPSGRPEDIEIHPRTKEVFIAMTDNAAGSDGYPDSRVFAVAKYKTPINTKQQYGGLYKIAEDSANGAGLTFRWARFSQGGEAGASEGMGFANLDNLAFDAKMNVWGVTDMTTGLHNAVQDGPTPGGGPVALPVNHTTAGSGGVNGNMVGVFGNNWLYYIPTEGPAAGQIIPFAIGPVRCEMTGPTFVGNTLVISVQHPGEDSPFGAAIQNFARPPLELLKLDGSGVFSQNRTVPTGSAWPSNISGQQQGAPMPVTIGIRRKNGGSFV